MGGPNYISTSHSSVTQHTQHTHKHTAQEGFSQDAITASLVKMVARCTPLKMSVDTDTYTEYSTNDAKSWKMIRCETHGYWMRDARVLDARHTEITRCQIQAQNQKLIRC